jgi:hypothetical protein
MTECSHSAECIELIEDKFFECKVRCNNCGGTFTEKGWGIRGVGSSFLSGAFSFFRSQVASEVYKDVQK